MKRPSEMWFVLWRKRGKVFYAAQHIGDGPLNNNQTTQLKSRSAALSVLSNTLLTFFKLIVGITTNSVSILSEAIHSSVDLLASIIAWVAVRASGKAADQRHPFGHGKFENLSGTVEALLIFLAAGWILYESIHKLIRPEPVEGFGWGVGVMFLSAIVNWWISSRLMDIGKQTDSVALQADAWHLRTDVYTSVGVMLGLAIMWVGQRVRPDIDLHWVDPVAAILVATMILQAAWELLMQAGQDLVDVALPDHEVAWLGEYFANFTPTVRGFHRLLTRKAGASRFIEAHVVVDAEMSVLESHKITDRISDGIRARFPDTHVTIHIEPCTVATAKNTCQAHCLAGCLNHPMAEAGGFQG